MARFEAGSLSDFGHLGGPGIDFEPRFEPLSRFDRFLSLLRFY